MKIANISEQEAAMYCMIERMAELEKENDMKFNDTFKVGFTVGFLDCMEYLADELEAFKKGFKILLKDISKEECPSHRNLKDTKRKSTTETTCIYGDGKHQKECMECWEKSLQENYIEKIESEE